MNQLEARQFLLPTLLRVFRVGGPGRSVNVPCGAVLAASGYDLDQLAELLRAATPENVAAEVFGVASKPVEVKKPAPAPVNPAPEPVAPVPQVVEPETVNAEPEPAPEPEPQSEDSNVAAVDEAAEVVEPEPEAKPEGTPVELVPQPAEVESEPAPEPLPEPEPAPEPIEEPAPAVEAEAASPGVETLGLSAAIVKTLNDAGISTVAELKAVEDVTTISGMTAGRAVLVRKALEKV